MKQKIVIRVSMTCEKSRSKAMALAAGATGVTSMGIAGDGKDRLEVVGDGVDPVCLVTCLRRKLGCAEILQVEEVKDKKKPEVNTKPDDEPKKLVPAHPPPQFYPGHCQLQHYYYPPPPLPTTDVYDEPCTCSVM